MESNQNSYQLKQGDQEYVLYVCLLGDIINMNCKNSQNIEYTRKFTLEEFKSLDAKFSNIKTPVDAINFFDNIIREEKVGVNEDDSKIIITIYLTAEALMHQINIHLGKNGVLTEDLFSVNGNVSYGSTNNLENNFNNSENNNYNQFVGLGTQKTVDTNTNNYFGTNNTSYDNLGGYNTNNTKTTTNYGLGRYKSHYNSNSVPLPSYNSKQYSFSNNNGQYIPNYGNSTITLTTTSLESKVNPAPTLKYTDTTTKKNTTKTNTFDIDEFLRTSPNVVPPVLNDLMRPSLNKKKTFGNYVFRSPQVQTINEKIDFNLENRKSIFSSPVTFSLPRRYKKLLETEPKTEPEIQPKPSIDLNALNSQPQPGIDLFSNQEQANTTTNANTNTNANIDYNTYQTSEQQFNFDSYTQPQPTMDYASYQYQEQPKVDTFHSTQQTTTYNTYQTPQPQPRINYTTYTTTYQSPPPMPKIDLNAYKPQPIVKTQRSTQRFEQKIINSPAVQRPSLAQKVVPTEKYKFGITLFKSPENTAKIEKITEITRKTETNVKYNDDKINKLEEERKSLRSGQQQLNNKLNELTSQINFYKNQLGILERDKSNNEVDALRAENQAIKQQLSELNNLRDTAAEVKYLRNKLSELDPLKRKAAEMEAIKGQLNELNQLRARVNELGTVKSQIDELNRLKSQVSQMNNLQDQLNELNNLKRRVAEAENYKNKVEEMEAQRTKYEQDIQNLRNSQKIELLKFKKMANSQYDTKKLIFDERISNITVKGDIIRNMDELEMITRKINKINHKIILNLIYKATADSDKAEAFHDRCDSANSSLVLIETNKGKRFGGFTTCSWSGDCVDKKDDEAFIFSLDKMMTYDIIPGEDAVGCYPKFGPIFLGCQIRIYDDAFTKGGTTYEKGLNYNTEEDFELTGGDRTFGVKEIEVYEVITH